MIKAVSATSKIRDELIRGFGSDYLHEHDTGVFVEPSGRGIQTVTLCVAARPTFHRISQMEEILETLGFHLGMEIVGHFHKEKAPLRSGSCP